MKKIIFLLSVLLIAGGCGNGKEKLTLSPGSVTLSVIDDVTDKHIVRPLPDPLLQLYHCNDNPDMECLFRRREISDRMLTPVSYCRLADGNTTAKENKNNDPQFRKRSVIVFYERVRQIIGESNAKEDTMHSLNNSECFKTICSELTILAANSSTRNYLAVFSDLNEKSDLYDVYNRSPVAEDIGNIILENDLLPERLDKVTVFFVFSPKDREQDKQYNLIAGIFKKLIESKGGRVIIQASNSSYNL